MSNADTRRVATDALATLGTVLADDNAHRDAIHIAVEPVICGEEFLYAGDHVKVYRGGVAYRVQHEGTGLGIVDPFLQVAVERGQRFWLLLYPGQIQSLRHVWEHPDLPEVTATAPPPPTEPREDSSKEISERWLRNFCETADCPSYEAVMELLEKGKVKVDGYGVESEIDDEFLFFVGRDGHGAIPEEFWVHAENVLGRRIPFRPTSISCTC